MKSCCFTGHRIVDEQRIQPQLLAAITEAIAQGYRHFIAGGAIGFDMIAAEQVLRLKENQEDLILEIAVPCLEQDLKYSPSQKLRYRYILDNADRIHKRELPYSSDCMMQRNRYMVDSSSLVIAFCDGRPSGTRNTLNYAEQRGVEIWRLK